MSEASTLATGWFSPNPDKAWVEKFFLLYSPVWMASMAIVMLTGKHSSWSDAALLLHAAATALPVLLVPLWHTIKEGKQPWWRSYGVKANLYLLVFGFFGNYIGSEYFFDVLGMVYRFENATTTLDSAMVGSGKQSVPLIMYAYTHVYFMTYHATANLVLRRLLRSKIPGRRALFPVFVLIVGYAWAWAETKAMANPLMAENFYYQHMDRMLAFGSAIYATYFLASFPFWTFLDESPQRPWTLLETTAAALSASMLTMYMLEIAAKAVGAI